MPVFKNEDNGTWYVMARYVNWKGERKQKCKRGFATKKEAQEWERMFQLQNSSDLDMSFEAFTELYINDVKNRLKENTWLTKEHIIRTKILPYFGKLKISEISTKEIITWQNEMLAYRDDKKKPYSQTYLKTLHNQLSAIFNHAVRYYELRSNPAAKVGNMGSEEHKEMLLWTKEEYKKFLKGGLDIPPPMGESMRDVVYRSFEALNIIISDMMYEGLTNCAVVTHGGIIMNMLSCFGVPKLDAMEYACDFGEGFEILISASMWQRSNAFELLGRFPYKTDENEF